MLIDPLTLGVLVLLAAVVVLIVILVRRRRNQPPAPVSGSTGRTNGLAIAGFVLSFFMALPAVVLAHVSLSQIRRTGDGGRGLAIAALWIGYAGIAIALVLVFLVPYYVSQGRYA